MSHLPRYVSLDALLFGFLPLLLLCLVVLAMHNAAHPEMRKVLSLTVLRNEVAILWHRAAAWALLNLFTSPKRLPRWAHHCCRYTMLKAQRPRQLQLVLRDLQR